MNIQAILILCFSVLLGLTSCTQNSSSSSADDFGEWHFFAANDSQIRIAGRADFGIRTRPTFAWSGTAIEFAFVGTAARIHIQAPGSVFNVFLDGDTLPSKILDLSESSDSVYLLADHLPAGSHWIRVYKRTEAIFGDAVFSGIDVIGDSSLAALPAPNVRKIEFIGNSITCGYGDLDSLPENPFDILTEDHSITYAALSARHLKAQERTVCMSGRGIYRNSDNTLTMLLPELYPLIQLSSITPWDFSLWTPDIVVINLGTNDFAGGIPDSASFVDPAIALVKTIHGNYPSAKIILADGPMLLGNSLTVCRLYLDAVQSEFEGTREPAVERLSFAPQTGSLGYGADWHPSRKQHALMAVNLEVKIKAMMNW